MSVADDAVFLSMPVTVRDAAGYPNTTPIGFVVTKDLVATIRFEHLPSFEKLANNIATGGRLVGKRARRDRIDLGDRR